MDLSPNRFYFTQTSSDDAPVYDEDGFNGYPSVDFNLDYMENISSKMLYDFIGNGNESTVFIVMNSLGDTSNDQRLWSNILNDNRSFELLTPYTDDVAEFWWGGSDARHDTVHRLFQEMSQFL